MGAVYVPTKTADHDPSVVLFWVQLGEFTGGHVAGVTVYRDSYRSNSVITVVGTPYSAYSLDGWKLNDTVIPNAEGLGVFSFNLKTNTVVTPLFTPVKTEIVKARQRYPWNNLVDIDYSVAESDAKDYRLVFFAEFVDDGGTPRKIQLMSFVDNAGKDVSGKYVPERLGARAALRRTGSHRVTWDSAKDGVRLKGKTVRFSLIACEGDER